MVINKKYKSKVEILEVATNLMSAEFKCPERFAKHAVDFRLKPIIDSMISEIHAVFETPYVDKVYRDSYYGYFSSKSQDYNRDCIRISFFSCEINDETFRDASIVETIKNNYLGFIVLRPTLPNIIGRTVINPKAFIDNNVSVCSTLIPATVDSIKFNVEGFPWSSQDTETITCAETTLWSLMEYFGNRYAEYRPILPTKLIETLKRVSTERQVPSKGLNLQQMSFALKEFGFGTRIYHKPQYLTDFNSLIGSYVEGGIPIITALENGEIKHASLCIGQCDVTDDKIDSLGEKVIGINRIDGAFKSKGLKIYDYQEIERDFIFIDDNRPPYEKASRNAPTIGYPDANWHSCQISAIIVPLHTKIYLEAYEAKNYALNLISQIYTPASPDEEILIRAFLCSNRSYKHGLALDSDMDIDIRNILLELSMPKFVWIIELSTKSLVKNKKANGLIILDATEASTTYFDPLVAYIHNGELISFDPSTNDIVRNPLTLNEFSIFENNLKKF